MFDFSQFTDPTSPYFISNNDVSKFVSENISNEFVQNNTKNKPPKPIIDSSNLVPIFNIE